MNIIELLKQPKVFVEKCQEHLTALGYTNGYDYDRYINEEVGELLNNHTEGRHENNRALLVDDIVDSMWVIFAKFNFNTPLNMCMNCTPYYPIDYDRMRIDLGVYLKYEIQEKLASLLYDLTQLSSSHKIDWQSAFSALVEENMSKLNFPEDMRAEVFRDGKCNKKDPQGNLYPWYKPADFSLF